MGHRDDLLVTRQYTRMTNAAGGPPTRSVCLLGFVQVGNGYTIQFDNKIYRIARTDIRAGLRGAQVRIEVRLDGSMAVRFRDRYLGVSECSVRPKAVAPAKKPKKHATAPRPKSQWMKNFYFTNPDKAALFAIPAKPIR